jgi:hypothetical protein
MKLLFNKGGQGSAEIKQLLGFTDGDLRFDNLKPKIYPATDSVIEIIGGNLYEVLIGIYEASSNSENDAEFLRRVQTVIILDAYRNYAKDNDLSHSSNGRVNQIDDKQKLAWEWQIVNSDRKMERDYYILFDKLIKYMDANVSGWKATQAYKDTFDSFIRTASDIDEYFNIEGSRLLFMKLLPGIKKAEREEIIPLLTKDKFDELKTALKENTPGTDETLLNLIKEALVYKGLSWGIPRLSAQLFPEGVLQVADASRLSISARKSAEKFEADSLSQRFAKDAQQAFEQIAKHLKSLEQSTLPVEEYKRYFNADDKFVDC